MADQVINFDPLSGGGGRREVLIKQISWPAIFSGVLVALGVEVLFLTFGSFIGFRMSPGAGANAWTVAWTFFGAFISFFVGGWVAGSLGGNPATGRAHGLVTWGLATVTTFVFVAVASWGVVTQAVGVVQTAALAASNMAPVAVNGGITPNDTGANRGMGTRMGRSGEANRALEQQANQALNQAQSAWPYAARAVANQVSNLSLYMWIAFMIAVAGAVLGGAKGAPRTVAPTRI